MGEGKKKIHIKGVSSENGEFYFVESETGMKVREYFEYSLDCLVQFFFEKEPKERSVQIILNENREKIYIDKLPIKDIDTDKIVFFL